jgi:nucleotide-binding universal stress UspA family protein
MAEAAPMPAQIAPGSIIVGLDGSTSSGWALEWAVGEAARRRWPLALVHTVDRVPSHASAAEADNTGAAAVLQDDGTLADALEVVHREAPGLPVHPVALHGSAAGVLVEASASAATIVLGAASHRAVSRAHLGSVSHQVATHAQCPVVVVRRRASEDGAGAGDVVLGLDGSEVSTPATEYAFATASLQGLGLTVVHAWWREYLGGVLAHSPWEGDWSEVAEELERMMAEALSGWSEKYPDVEVHRHLVRGHAVEMLVQESEGAALLVVGSRGHGGFPGLRLGAVGNGVLHHADCPVAVVPPSRGATP